MLNDFQEALSRDLCTTTLPIRSGRLAVAGGFTSPAVKFLQNYCCSISYHIVLLDILFHITPTTTLQEAVWLTDIPNATCPLPTLLSK